MTYRQLANKILADHVFEKCHLCNFPAYADTGFCWRCNLRLEIAHEKIFGEAEKMEWDCLNDDVDDFNDCERPECPKDAL